MRAAADQDDTCSGRWWPLKAPIAAVPRSDHDRTREVMRCFMAQVVDAMTCLPTLSEPKPTSLPTMGNGQHADLTTIRRPGQLPSRSRTHCDHNTSCWMPAVALALLSASAARPGEGAPAVVCRLPFNISTCRAAVISARTDGYSIISTRVFALGAPCPPVDICYRSRATYPCPAPCIEGRHNIQGPVCQRAAAAYPAGRPGPQWRPVPIAGARHANVCLPSTTGVQHASVSRQPDSSNTSRRGRRRV